MSIFNLKTWVHYYVSLLKRLGALRFSLILAVAIICADSVLQVFLAHYFDEPLDIVDVARSFILGGLITPWAVYFLTVVVGDLEEAREVLDHTVNKLQVIVKNDQQKTIALESEIIERQNSQLQVEQSAILLRSFLDTSPDLFFHRDLDGNFVGCNKSMELLIGKTEKQLIGANLFEVFPEGYANEANLRDQRVKDTLQEQIQEHWMHYPNGRKAYFEVRVLPLFNSLKEFVGIIGFGRDITEYKKNQDILEKASKEKTTFISTISHELRTPLNGIVGLSRMLLDEKLTPQQVQYLKTIHISAITLGNIFNDIVDLDKLDRRRFDLVREKVELQDFLSDLQSLSYIQTQQKGLQLEFIQTGAFPHVIETDATRLRQVLWNIISNAVKFTEQGSITIRCRYEPGEINQLSFEVEDSGIGIPNDQLDKIFAMYYQVKGNANVIGTGIGLAISSQIVKMLGGKLSVESEPDVGSTFRFSIPVQVNQDKALDEPSLPSIKPLDILLVEDIELNILVARALLEKLGHHVDCAMDGAQALQKVSEHSYQLILMDIQLPDMDGFEITQKLRQIYGGGLPPIVALTANVFSDKEYFIERGMDDALSKPLGVDALNKVINKQFLLQDTLPEIPQHPVLLAEKVSDSLFDEEMLTDLLEFIPSDVMLDNIALFEKLMPDYLQILDSNMIAKDKEGIVNESHKIKGAAGSIGLKRIQKLAQQVQSPDLPAWWDNIDDWVTLMKSNYQQDIDDLKIWVTEHKS
ncbi:aerobic respiration two-component sensor histidine kinase ArcB [Psychromonas sp. PT13]|uniref:aerobic respiration two-component sensor histidine kinase ArcB n=1 Tax=Psychromonas sp. PT13 TaxID=3439547 RepID=UPI003EBD5D6F